MLVDFYFAGSVKLEEVASLRNALESLEGLRGEDGYYELLTKKDGEPTRLALDYETEELEKDLFFFEHGEEAFYRYIADRHPSFESHVRAVSDLLRPAAGATWITDRDGTVNNYCGRYRSSVQSAYNGVYLTRFARNRTGNALILTSAPLESFGLLDLSVMPDGTVFMAGSKGREFRDVHGYRHHLPIEAHKQSRLEELNRRLSDLVESPDYQEFGLIGSAVQFKFGQTTVARQDMYESIDPERSQAFLERVHDLVSELDPGGETFRIEDTGYDIEIILTRKEGDRDFNKGDGVGFVDGVSGLDLDGPVIVCGDTRSDLPMVHYAAERSRDLRTVFVTEDEELQNDVRSVAPQSVFVEHPDVLVLALGRLAKE
jgi:hypothetical protein